MSNKSSRLSPHCFTKAALMADVYLLDVNWNIRLGEIIPSPPLVFQGFRCNRETHS